MLYDTLKYNGVERSFAAWGIARDGIESVLGNARADTFRFFLPTANISDDPVFPYFASVIAQTNRASASGADNSFSGGSIEFQGKRVNNPMKAAGQKVGVHYEFQGPWYDLDITQYTQTYKGQTTNYNPGEVVLNTAAFPAISTAGLRFISVGDQIQSILQCVLDGYAAQGLPAPFQYVGRDLNAGAIDLNVGAGPPSAPNENTDKSGAPYLHLVNTGTTIALALFRFFLPSDIIRPLSAAQCLQKLMDATPRTNISFDYSTTPPTIYFDNLDTTSAASLPLFDGVSHKSLDLQKRDDLVPSAIIIGYRIKDSVDSGQVVDYVEDKWGPHGFNSGADPSTGPGVIIQTIDLQGFSETFAKASLDVEPLACRGGSQASKRGWWSSKRGGEVDKLADYRVRFQDATGAATTIPDAKFYYASAGFDFSGVAVAKDQEFTAVDYAVFIYRINGGTQHSWMTVGGVPVKAVKVKIVAAGAQYAQYDCLSATNSDMDATGNPPRRVTEDLTITTQLTNGVSGPYSTIASFTTGESFILGAGGIAQYLFNMLSVIQYEGEYVKVEANFSGGVTLRNRLNLTGGRGEWTTMNAQIQEIKKDWGNKETSVRVGVSKHLSADQLSAFLNMWAQRRTWYNPALKADNTVASSGEVEMPNAVPAANTVEGLNLSGQQTHTLYTTPPTGITPGVIAAQLNHDPKKVKAILDATTPTLADPLIPAHIMEPIELPFCDINNNLQYRVVLAGGAYTKP